MNCKTCNKELKSATYVVVPKLGNYCVPCFISVKLAYNEFVSDPKNLQDFIISLNEVL